MRVRSARLEVPSGMRLSAGKGTHLSAYEGTLQHARNTLERMLTGRNGEGLAVEAVRDGQH